MHLQSRSPGQYYNPHLQEIASVKQLQDMIKNHRFGNQFVNLPAACWFVRQIRVSSPIDKTGFL